MYVGQTNSQQTWLNLNEPMKNNCLSFSLLLSVFLFCFCIFPVATMTAALSNMGTLSSLLPLPSITNKPPPVPTQPNISALDEVKRKVAKQANSISIKEFTDVRSYSLYYTCGHCLMFWSFNAHRKKNNFIMTHLYCFHSGNFT